MKCVAKTTRTHFCNTKLTCLRVPGGGSLSDSRCSPSAASSKTLFIKDIKINKGNEKEPISNYFLNIPNLPESQTFLNLNKN